MASPPTQGGAPPPLGPPLIITTDLDHPATARPTAAGPPVINLVNDSREDVSRSGAGQTAPVTPPRHTQGGANGLSPAHGSDAGHLSAPNTPSGPHAHPPSPTLTSVSTAATDDLYTPVSPTHKGATSLALRENQPTKDSGKQTLSVIGGNEPGLTRHQRAGSEVTWASADETAGGKSHAADSPTKMTPTHSAAHGNLDPGPDKPKKSFGQKLMFWKKDKPVEDEDGEADPKQQMGHIDASLDTTDPTPFAHNPSKLAALLDPKSLEELEKLGGIEGVLHGLGADGARGLKDSNLPADAKVEADGMNRDAEAGGPAHDGPQYRASFDERKGIYGDNTLPKKKSKTFLQLCWGAFQDKMLILLTVAAVVSLALGIYQSIGGEPEYVRRAGCPEPLGCEIPRVDWIEGVAIAVAVTVIVLVSSLSDWRKEKQFQVLNEQREDRTVTAIRNGKQININTKDVVVGDVLTLAPGEVLPCDGIFLRGSDCKADEAAATGESDLIKKAPYDECIAERDALKEGGKLKKDCFMISGSKIADGVGEYLVIAVGRKSFNGRLMMALQGEAEATPLQVKLNKLADKIALFGGGAGGLLFFALMIRFFVQLKSNPGRTPDQKGQDFIQILIISVTLVVVSVPEGLPLAVVLALSFATRKMMSQNLLVRVLASCETMGNATVIATDKTGTLTKADMQVVAGSLGVHGKFVQRLQENAARNNANKVIGEDGQPIRDQERMDFALDASELPTVVSPPLLDLISTSIAINSTAFEEIDKDTGKPNFVGSKTETALLKFAKELGTPPAGETRQNADVIRMIPFSSEQKCMACIIRLPNGRQRLLVKGASEILTKVSSKHIKVARGDNSTLTEVEAEEFNDDTRDNINRSIIFYANQSLRTIAMCYRDFDAKVDLRETELFELARDLTLVMIVGIEDPLREGVIEAVANCQKASIRVVMVTGDNVLTARSIAKQCGILTPGGLIMEGPSFRALGHSERVELIPYLQILARSSPEDKRLLVETYKELGETVAASGDGANDAAALKLANVGFSMGIAGTEVAKSASDIIIMDDSFASMVTACMWGRAVNDAVRKFLQFQLAVNVSAIIITFVSAVASSEESSVLTAVQLLWINLVMDTLAALALASQPPNRKILDRKPDRQTAPLLSADMLKMILGQAIFQAIVCLVLHFAGLRILGLSGTDDENAELSSLVFNVFVFCQIFNIINCRRVDRQLNVFEDLFKNVWFLGIFLVILGGQVLIAFIGGRAFSVVRINGRDWAISIIVGLISLPLGVLIRLLPTAPFERALIKMHLYPDPNKLPVIAPASENEKDQYEYNDALTKVRDNLSTFAKIRGGRLSSSNIVFKSRHSRMRKAQIQYPSLLTMLPTLIAGTVGAGSGWANKMEEWNNPAAADPSRSSAHLWQGKLVFYEPDVNSDIYKKYGPKGQ